MAEPKTAQRLTPLTPLKTFTNARIALGHAGGSLPLSAHLQFQQAHALARDAVNIPLDFQQLQQQMSSLSLPMLHCRSQVLNRQHYLQRPDLGRLPDEQSLQRLKKSASSLESHDLLIVVADGLSSSAISRHAYPFLQRLLPQLSAAGVTLAPLCLAEYARVALADPIGEALGSRMSVILIGERPGLSSPDSMGIYFTYQPASGKTDAERNCISNIHRQGLDYATAISKLMYLVQQAQYLGYSGVRLKDDSGEESDKTIPVQKTNFLLD